MIHITLENAVLKMFTIVNHLAKILAGIKKAACKKRPFITPIKTY